MKLSMPITRSLRSALVFFGVSAVFCLTTTHAQQRSAQKLPIKREDCLSNPRRRNTDCDEPGVLPEY